MGAKIRATSRKIMFFLSWIFCPLKDFVKIIYLPLNKMCFLQIIYKIYFVFSNTKAYKFFQITLYYLLQR